ncbi:MAG: class I SAM-dependent methyltransferase [Acidimicrobiales bacterium]
MTSFETTQSPTASGSQPLIDRQALWAALDEALNAEVASATDDLRWLAVQTVASAPQRRALIGSLSLPQGSRVLDVGCGFGAATIELAGNGDVVAVGVDSDSDALTAARRISRSLARRTTSASLRTEFVSCDAYALPFPDGSFDIVFSRFVFQHLTDPLRAAGEVARVLASGGTACVVDVDDGLSISDPAPSEAFATLAGALRAAQTARGGDRFIGRRLAGLLDRCGLVPGPLIVLPQAAYHRPDPSGAERSLMIERLSFARSAIISGRHLSADEFDRALAEFAREDQGPSCEIEAHLAVLASKPQDTPPGL